MSISLIVVGLLALKCKKFPIWLLIRFYFLYNKDNKTVAEKVCIQSSVWISLHIVYFSLPDTGIENMCALAVNEHSRLSSTFDSYLISSAHTGSFTLLHLEGILF